ncbi:MAG: hypothetical protein GWO20_05750 [Candidatus Korarchaeota archaeon]|nr:hypothetical protein [Candidatus Korarchaeota archaeon]NIU82959.1 hypothetical protein [Candidatus Thorarchaeota archaeon]NIW13382.1 hypothetical protein [Candidatus Thorarchaeota archaeon]NIW51482.1 hypothetical protein [Candidatus Korarchaeota archaeon]
MKYRKVIFSTLFLSMLFSSALVGSITANILVNQNEIDAQDTQSTQLLNTILKRQSHPSI